MWKSVLLLLAVAALAGCGAKEPQTSADYLASAAYQDRALLQQSLFRSDQELLSNEEIETILSSRIQIPRDGHLTVLRLGSTDELLVWAFLTGTSNPFSSVAENPRLSRLSWLPSLLVPEKLNVPALREAAARFQADLLFLYRTPCQQFTSYRLFGPDTGKTYCVAEGLLLDVRTGVIPFSTATAREVKVRQSEEDIHFYETMRRAESETSAEALADLAAQLSSFLASAP